MRSYMKPGATEPVIGTDICGLPRNGVVSFGVSHGSILGCCLKSVNHEQPVSASDKRNIAHLPSPIAHLVLAFTANLLSSMLLEQVHRLIHAIGIGHDPDTKVPAAEARVIPNSH